MSEDLVKRNWSYGVEPRVFGVRLQSEAQFCEVFGRFITAFQYHKRRGRTVEEVAELWWSKADEDRRAQISAILEEIRNAGPSYPVGRS
jgi:hypothetical protein